MVETMLYLDPWSGVSGDMLLAALLDTDRDEGRLEAELRRTMAGLGLGRATIEVLRDVEWGLSCTRVQVVDRGVAPLRHLAEMERAIADAPLSEQVKEQASQAVRQLAAVEAEVHGCAVDEIHFHEVGAVDTLVDVVGVFSLVEALGVGRVVVGTIPVGGGTVEITHGRMGVPAPATARLLEGYAIVGGPELRELTTPTGALLVGQLGAQQGALPLMKPAKIGYGAGSMRLDHGPNLLRVMIGAAGVPGEVEPKYDNVVELQTNLDDVSPEVIGHTVHRLRDAGALDVWTVPVCMKKDRPGVVLHALVRPSDEGDATGVMFEETGTLGVRRQVVSRQLAVRGVLSVTVGGTEIRVKWGRYQGRLVSVAPEYDDSVNASASTGLPLKDVMHLATEAAREQLVSEALGGR